MSSTTIHPTAVVDSSARLGEGVRVGPHCYVGPDVVLGAGCVLRNNATVTGGAICGKENVFFAGAVVGEDPQDLKYKGGRTRLEIGDDNVFRECVTVNRGTEVAGGITRVGSHNRFMAGVHLAHDVVIGDRCILSNYVQLAGHVRLEDMVTMGGIIGVHHFTTIGRLAYVGGMSRLVSDVPPYMIVEGHPSRVRGFNETGMRRWGMTEDQIRCVREAYRVLFSPRAAEYGATLNDRLTFIEEREDLNGDVRYLCESVRRSTFDGVYGRQLERLRRDSDADREQYYGNNKESAESDRE